MTNSFHLHISDDATVGTLYGQKYREGRSIIGPSGTKMHLAAGCVHYNCRIMQKEQLNILEMLLMGRSELFQAMNQWSTYQRVRETDID